jgi:D-tyrosyl-tRNA(Tyr) deacylase
MRTAVAARQNVSMRAVVQRVDGASVEVEGKVIGAFTGPGLLVLIGVSVDDDESKCAVLADKIWKLRIFESAALKEAGKSVNSESVEVAAADANLPILAISQFTLFADTSNGRRPTWQQAARGPQAEPLVEKVVTALRDLGAQVETGKFGAVMRISAVCDGPMTVTLEV